LIGRIPDGCIASAESGLRTHDDLVKLRAAGSDAFLIGHASHAFARSGRPLPLFSSLREDAVG